MFVQIGNKAININRIVYVMFIRNDEGFSVRVHLSGEGCEVPFDLNGEEAAAFFYWWRHKADVYKAL